ncbi:hypothetical protein L209DRAFT_747233 [Thermothelomyces heterothallicus CBS 203.75]
MPSLLASWRWLLSSVPGVAIPGIAIPGVATADLRARRFLNLMISLMMAIYSDSFLTLDRDSDSVSSSYLSLLSVKSNLSSSLSSIDITDMPLIYIPGRSGDGSLTSDNSFLANQGIRTSFLSANGYVFEYRELISKIGHVFGRIYYLSGNIGMSGGFGPTCRETGGSSKLISQH